MVGTRASCQPIPVLMIDAPAMVPLAGLFLAGLSVLSVAGLFVLSVAGLPVFSVAGAGVFAVFVVRPPGTKAPGFRMVEMSTRHIA